MNERATNDTALDEEERQKDMLARGDGQRDNELPGRPEEKEASQATTSSDGKMSTADLAYGRKDPGADRQEKSSSGTEEVTLIQEEDAGGFRERWTSIQTHFIDAAS